MESVGCFYRDFYEALSCSDTGNGSAQIGKGLGDDGASPP